MTHHSIRLRNADEIICCQRCNCDGFLVISIKGTTFLVCQSCHTEFELFPYGTLQLVREPGAEMPV